jgi:hypothetical protein
MRNIPNYGIAIIPADFPLNESPDKLDVSAGDLITCLKHKRIQAEQGKKGWMINGVTQINRITRPLMEKPGNQIDYMKVLKMIELFDYHCLSSCG